jgi:hypothetical protein
MLRTEKIWDLLSKVSGEEMNMDVWNETPIDRKKELKRLMDIVISENCETLQKIRLYHNVDTTEYLITWHWIAGELQKMCFVG